MTLDLLIIGNRQGIDKIREPLDKALENPSLETLSSLTQLASILENPYTHIVIDYNSYTGEERQKLNEAIFSIHEKHPNTRIYFVVNQFAENDRASAQKLGATLVKYSEFKKNPRAYVDFV
jgi:hypothetical protein